MNKLSFPFVVDHTAVAVSSIDEFLQHFSLLSDASSVYRESLPDQGLKVAFLPDPFKLELLEPTDSSSTVYRFIQKRGSGAFHHIAYKVSDLQATLDSLGASGIPLLDVTPRQGSRGKRIAFIHPRATSGILVELCEGTFS